LAEKVTKKYGKKEVLKEVNLKISKGEFYALMGPNGSGKTTLASILASVKSPTSGKIQIFGRLSIEVNLTGCTTVAAIENALRIARHEAKVKAKTAKSWQARRRWWFKADEIDKLIEHGFAERVIAEARRRPRGFIALTLRFGRKTAMQKILAQQRAGARPRINYSQLKRIPELRRKEVYRSRHE
jgi:ATPase subunit of ABC transporter with duplicated ATPase domains